MRGKIALVTGSSSGIGRATAIAFANKGAKVVIADINEAGGEETVQMVGDAGGEAIFIRTDVANEEDVKAMVAGTVEVFGGLNYAVNNAAIEGAPAPLHEIPIDTWHQTIAVNLTGVFLCMKYEIEHMLAHGGGAIVNTSSTAGVVGFGGLAAYAASKHGVTGLSRTAALDYGAQGIRVNSVHPGGIKTEMLARALEEIPGLRESLLSLHPIGRVGEPREAADVIVWLCSDEASFVIGHTMLVDGGSTAQ